MFNLIWNHQIALKSFFVSCYFCHLLITFANSLEPDQDRQKVGTDLDSKQFDTPIVLLKDFLKTFFLLIKSQQMAVTACKELIANKFN